MSIALKNKVVALIQDLGGPDTENLLCALRNLPGQAVEPLATAFHDEPDGGRRALLILPIWQLRDERALPVLLDALRDPHAEVWKCALDGLVTIGGRSAIEGLEGTPAMVAGLADATLRLEWCQEALDQIRDAKERSEGHAG
jgi:HEAT repeat protein